MKWTMNLVSAVGTVLLLSGEAFAQFSVGAQFQSTISSVKADIVGWGVAFIGVALVAYAYHKVLALVEENVERSNHRQEVSGDSVGRIEAYESDDEDEPLFRYADE